MNWWMAGEATLSRGTPTFAVSKLAQDGTLVEVLDAYCGARAWQLCGRRDLIAANRGHEGWFLWGADSPIHELGWEQGGGEQADVALHALRCCWQAGLAVGLRDAWAQL